VEPEAMTELVARYWEGLWVRRDLGVVDELIADPYRRHTSAGTRMLRRAEFKRDLKDSWRLLHDPATTIDDQVAAGDRVWTRATTQGVNLDTGETSVLTWLVIHRIEGHQIAEAWIASLPGVDWR
jgi:hypothetical protein